MQYFKLPEYYSSVNRGLKKMGSYVTMTPEFAEYGRIAQSVEQLPLKQTVGGSNPSAPTFWLISYHYYA